MVKPSNRLLFGFHSIIALSGPPIYPPWMWPIHAQFSDTILQPKTPSPITFTKTDSM